MKKIILIICFFFLIYEPPFPNLRMIYILGYILGCVYIFFYHIKARRMLNYNATLTTYFFLYFINCYILLIVLLNGTGNNTQFLAWGIVTLPTIYAIILWAKFNSQTFFQTIIWVGLIQSILATISYVFPYIQNIFVHCIYQSGETYATAIHSAYRLYGFASNLTFSTPIVQAVICVIAFYFAIEKAWKYIIVSILIGFSAVINARTALAIILVGVICIIIDRSRNKREIIRIIFILVILSLAVFFISKWMQNNSSNNFEWVMSGINDLLSLFTGEIENGYFAYVVNEDKYILPQGAGILFGKGIRIMLGNSKYEVASDIGYINDIWYGGIVYCCIVYIFTAFLIYQMYKQKIIYPPIVVMLLFVFLLGNFKGYIISSNNFMTLFLVLAVYGIFVNNKEYYNNGKRNNS